eukprot:scaffold3.g6616.t1
MPDGARPTPGGALPPGSACTTHEDTLTTVLLVNLASILERMDEQWIGASFNASPAALGMVTLARHCLHRGRVVGAGCLLWAASTALFAAAHSLAAGLPIWAVNGLGLALVLPNCQSLTADLFAPAARGRAFGLLSMTAALGGMGGALYATNLGSRRPLGVEGWRFAFLSMAAVSAAAGVASLLWAGDPSRPNQQHQQHELVSSEDLEEYAADAWQGAGDVAAPEAPGAAGVPPAVPDWRGAGRDGAGGPRIRKALGEMSHILAVSTFLLVVAQGVFGSIPWAAFVFLTLYFQLLGMSDAAASLLVALFLAGTAAGSLVGGAAGDAAARRWPRHGRLAATQFSVAVGLPFAFILIKGLPRDGRPATVALYGVVLAAFALLKAWPANSFNNPAFAEIVPSSQRSLVYALDRALEGALAAFAAPLVGLLASRGFGFDGSATVSDDRKVNQANAEALGEALLAFMVVPWSLTLLLYTVLHWTYPADRRRAAEREAALASSLLTPAAQAARPQSDDARAVLLAGCESSSLSAVELSIAEGRGLEVRDAGEGRGKGVFATQAFAEGDLLFTELPLAAIQHSFNRPAAWVCGHCFRFLGSVEQQLGRLLLAVQQRQQEGSDAASSDGSESSGGAGAASAIDDAVLQTLIGGQLCLPLSDCLPLPAPVRCRGGCADEWYCSTACEAAAWERCHQLLCTGPADAAAADAGGGKGKQLVATGGAQRQQEAEQRREQAAAMTEFTDLADATNDVFRLAAVVVAITLLRAERLLAQQQQAAWLPFAVGHKGLWWECTAAPAEAATDMRHLAADSLALLRAALPPWLAARYPALLSLERYEELLEGLPGAERQAALQEAGPYLDALPEEVPGCEGNAFYALHSCLNHSCAPSVHAWKREQDTDGSAVVLALRNIAPGEEVTISYIEEDAPLEERRAELADYGFVCRCSRCRDEEAALGD